MVLYTPSRQHFKTAHQAWHLVVEDLLLVSCGGCLSGICGGSSHFVSGLVEVNISVLKCGGDEASVW